MRIRKRSMAESVVILVEGVAREEDPTDVHSITWFRTEA
jgi:hypothetical protein